MTGVWKVPELSEAMPSWFDDAACKDVANPDIFFPNSYDIVTTAPAKAVCDSCPIKWSCRRWAIDTRQRYGIWGSTTPSERVHIRRREPRKG